LWFGRAAPLAASSLNEKREGELMGGVCGIHAESWSVSGFDEDAPGGTERRLAGVIVARGADRPRGALDPCETRAAAYRCSP
jgi:hypothetical protein